MDGRRRLAEPVTDGVAARPKAGAAPASWRTRARAGVLPLRLERALRRLFAPVERLNIPRGSGVAGAVVLIAGSIAFGTVRGGHIEEAAAGFRDARDAIANAVGFRITSIALAGQRQLTRAEILAAAGISGRSSLLFLDATQARARLRANPWISEATVLKLYPGRLHIAITERDAFALWQKDGKISVISADGTVVESFVRQEFTKLPLVVGEGAATRARDFLALMDKHPQLRSQMHAAVLVAERRWNLALNSGIDVRLPETEVEAALAMLVKLDASNKLLSRDITSIDLRLPDRVTVRLSDEAVAARQEALKGKAKKKGGAA